MGKKQESIEKAYADGHLLIHMMEVNAAANARFMANEKMNVRSIFDVMHGETGASYQSDYHVAHAGDKGFIGLPCTALHKDFPVIPYSQCDRVGIIMDAHDNENVKPIMVGSSDLYSKSYNGKIAFSPTSMVSCLAEMQGVKPDKDKHRTTTFHIASDLDELAQRAENALPEMWKAIKEMGWTSYTREQTGEKGMNEVSAAVKLAGVKGLVVNGYYNRLPPSNIAQSNYVRDVNVAKTIRDWLSETYPKVFPEKLPIYFYNPQCKKEMFTELDEEQLRHPVMPERSPWQGREAARQSFGGDMVRR